MKKTIKNIVIIFAAFMFFPILAAADVKPGEVINKGNCEKIKGMVPDFIYLWVKKGDLVMKIGNLSYDPLKYLPKEFQSKANKGRYKVVENNTLKDMKSGTMHPHPHDVKGFPFPEPDINDPTAPLQMLYNFNFHEYETYMPSHENQFWLSIGRKGLEKTYEMEIYRNVFEKGSRYDYGEVSRFTQPFDIAGTGSMVNYHMNPLKDGIRYAYSPLIRKVKRLTHRLAGSENNFEVDLASDDNWPGGPRTDLENGRYKFLREQVALVPYVNKPPAKAVINKKGEIEIGYTQAGNELKMGFEDPTHKGAPWHPSELIWVKRKVYVFESKSVNPNYRYGPCEGWMEKGLFTYVYKRITDINGNLWKGSYYGRWTLKSKDGKYKNLHWGPQVTVDMKRDHGSAFLHAKRKGGYKTLKLKKVNKRLFTRSGFIKFTR